MKFSALCTLAIGSVASVAAQATTDDRFPGHYLRANSNPGSLGIDTSKQIAGYLDIEDQDKHFFYWFFESRNDPANDPVILWLTGGPGCSSLTAALFENGPAFIDADLNVVHNPYSWNNNASVIYLDEPVGTGFSYSSNKDVTTSVLAAEDVYAFLELFFKANPRFSKLPFHVTGESYGGHTVPAVGSEILTHPDRSFNFQSIAVGNGLVDCLTQYQWYEPMLCGQGGNAPVVNETSCELAQHYQDICIPNIEFCYKDQSAYARCRNTTYNCNAVLGVYADQGGNLYDITKPCTTNSGSCYIGIDYLVKYLNQPKVQQALGVHNVTFNECNDDPQNLIIDTGDWMRPYQQNVTTILEKGFPVLIYNGDKDYICNWLGGHAWTDDLPWYGHSSFSNTSLSEWYVNGNASGQVKNYDNLTFLRVYEAGHFSPHDQPENVLAMINSWISGNKRLQ